MTKFFPQEILGILAILIINMILLNDAIVATPPLSSPYSVAVTPMTRAAWQDTISYQPPEKWLSPKWEDDERYKQRQQKKYRERK
ncbi:MAG: hypothetical protein H0X26_05460 [Alphaproteobacteria bacterium]|nr:hypothetical protein [Alphaproteobacteria bacterium]